MDKILAKMEAQNKKASRMIERDKNKLCSMCRHSMRENGFSSIPGICGKCEKEGVHGDNAHPTH